MAVGTHTSLRPVLRICNSSTFGRSGLFTRFYSIYPPDFIEPTNDNTLLEKIIKEKSKEEILKLKIKPAPNNHTTSVLYHPDVEKFINCLMKRGDKETASTIVKDAFTRVKHIQLRKYNSEKDPEKKKDILLSPVETFLLAIKNITPMLWTMKIKKSGTWYKIPVGITEEKAKGRAMKWLIEVANDKNQKISLKVQLAYEIIAAANYEGRAVAKKIELHKLCEANRGYANYWWT